MVTRQVGGRPHRRCPRGPLLPLRGAFDNHHSVRHLQPGRPADLPYVAFSAICWSDTTSERVEPRMDFGNSTDLDGGRLERLFARHAWPYRHEELSVRVRYSRGADFSGTCYYADSRIYVNLGRHTRFPYLLGTHIARSTSNSRYWWRETYRLVVADAYQLLLFVFLHEFYHYLVKRAGRNPLRKEAMCDRFAARVLVDAHDVPVVDRRGRPAPRANWDFQDLDRFVEAAPRDATAPAAAAAGRPRPIPVRIYGIRTGTRRHRPGSH